MGVQLYKVESKSVDVSNDAVDDVSAMPGFAIDDQALLDNLSSLDNMLEHSDAIADDPVEAGAIKRRRRRRLPANAADPKPKPGPGSGGYRHGVRGGKSAVLNAPFPIGPLAHSSLRVRIVL